MHQTLAKFRLTLGSDVWSLLISFFVETTIKSKEPPIIKT